MTDQNAHLTLHRPRRTTVEPLERGAESAPAELTLRRWSEDDRPDTLLAVFALPAGAPGELGAHMTAPDRVPMGGTADAAAVRRFARDLLRLTFAALGVTRCAEVDGHTSAHRDTLEAENARLRAALAPFAEFAAAMDDDNETRGVHDYCTLTRWRLSRVMRDARRARDLLAAPVEPFCASEQDVD